MKSWRSLDIYLWLVVSVVGVISSIFAQPVWAFESEKEQDTVVTRIQRVSETDFPATTQEVNHETTKNREVSSSITSTI